VVTAHGPVHRFKIREGSYDGTLGTKTESFIDAVLDMGILAMTDFVWTMRMMTRLLSRLLPW
jgi:hypothetical protein